MSDLLFWLLAFAWLISWALVFYCFVWLNPKAQYGDILVATVAGPMLGPFFAIIIIILGPFILFADWLEKKFPPKPTDAPKNKINEFLSKPLWTKPNLNPPSL